VQPELEAALDILLLTPDEQARRRVVRWARLLEEAAADGDMGEVEALLEDMVG
jgi:hypothetical protein